MENPFFKIVFFSSAVFLSIGKVNSLYDLIWYVGINDFILKFFAVIVKICIVLLPPEMLPHRKRVRYNDSAFFLPSSYPLINVPFRLGAIPLLDLHYGLLLSGSISLLVVSVE